MERETTARAACEGCLIEVGERLGRGGHSVVIDLEDGQLVVPVSREESMALAPALYERVRVTIEAVTSPTSDGTFERFAFSAGALAASASVLSEEEWRRGDALLARATRELAAHHPDPIVSGELAKLAELLAPEGTQEPRPVGDPHRAQLEALGKRGVTPWTPERGYGSPADASPADTVSALAERLRASQTVALWESLRGAQLRRRLFEVAAQFGDLGHAEDCPARDHADCGELHDPPGEWCCNGEHATERTTREECAELERAECDRAAGVLRDILWSKRGA